MGQKSLIYAFVARGTVILAEYTEFSGNFNSIAFQCLQKLPATNNKFTYNCDGHTFNYLVDNGYSNALFSLFLPPEKILSQENDGETTLCCVDYLLCSFYFVVLASRSEVEGSFDILNCS